MPKPPTSDQQGLMNSYNPKGNIPFIDFANTYDLVGAQVTPAMSGMNWTQIASQLNEPSSTIASNLDAAANYMISVICKIDGGQPSSVCSQTFALLPLSQILPQASQQQTTEQLVEFRGAKPWIL